jgi:hypothetical protein
VTTGFCEEARVTTSGERLQTALVRALVVLRGGDELEALRVVSEHLRAVEASDHAVSPLAAAEGARHGLGRARKAMHE